MQLNKIFLFIVHGGYFKLELRYHPNHASRASKQRTLCTISDCTWTKNSWNPSELQNIITNLFFKIRKKNQIFYKINGKNKVDLKIEQDRTTSLHCAARSWTTDTQWRHKSKKSKNLGQCGRQNMLRPYLKIWEWEIPCSEGDLLTRHL